MMNQLLDKKFLFFTFFTFISLIPVYSQTQAFYTEETPSRSEYFSWINNTNEGTTEEQTLKNINFFKWLYSEYGMILDIYAMDAGVIDGKNYYGIMDSDAFKQKFPKSFDKIVQESSEMKTRLGLWGGPDGFGDTKESAQRRKNEMVSLCRKYNWALFKFDAVCGKLKPENEDFFIDMMQSCRNYSKDLILLNHRLGLERAQKCATTFLWEGQETYIDVNMSSKKAVPYNRAVVLERGLTPDLKRLTEDHGVCLSSSLDYWQDDLILQAFNRSLILSPQIYGNPWLLKDDEFPQLARIFNLQKKYAKYLCKGIILPEAYGPFAVSRGDDSLRLITLRNDSWLPKTYHISISNEIGLKDNKNRVEVCQLHPSECQKGLFTYGDKFDIEVSPFRAVLLRITSKEKDDYKIYGVDYQVVSDKDPNNVIIDLLSMPSSTKNVRIQSKGLIYINGKQDRTLSKGKVKKIVFGGEKLINRPNRKLASMSKVNITKDVKALYEKTVFSADNNALEVRSLERSGSTSIKQVKDARDAFFNQKTFINRGIWDKNLFDGDMTTGFWPSMRYGVDQTINNGCLRLNLSNSIFVDKIVIKTGTERDLQPLLIGEGNFVYVSNDLINWKKITFIADTVSVIKIGEKVRYLKMNPFPSTIYEIEVYDKDGFLINPHDFKVTNLFSDSNKLECKAQWKCSFKLPELARDSYLCVAINGKHGKEGAYAAAKIGSEMLGATLRSPAFPSNTWEYANEQSDSNYTYYIPLNKSMIDKEIEVYVMGYDKDNLDLKPEVWIWTHEMPYEKIRLTISKD